MVIKSDITNKRKILKVKYDFYHIISEIGIVTLSIILYAMKIQQLYTKCLAEATYYVSSNNEAVIIDPLREIEPYLEILKTDNVVLKYIFLTHFHADFISGHVDLAKATGATIVYGPTAKADFKFHEGYDGEEFRIGNASIRLLHTPGHTLESSSYLLIDASGKEHCLFSGDTLFIGDVGRPDLAVSSNITKEDLAAKLFTSLHEKILTLPEDIIIYPNHGKGSACGKNMSADTFDTLANQKLVNYALNPNLSKDDFVKQVLDGLTTPPQYFPKNALMNKLVNKDITQVIKDGLSPISPEKFTEVATLNKALILDVRSTNDFIKQHVSNSIFIGLEGDFAPWVGSLITDINQPIILVAPKGKEKEAIVRLARIGYDTVLGYLEGDSDTWKTKGIKTESLSSVNAKNDELLTNVSFVDVRRLGEFNKRHVEHAIHIPLASIYNEFERLDKSSTYYVYCAGGYRSLIALSILKRLGFSNLINIDGGFKEILESKIPLSKCSNNCPSCACNT